MAVKAAIKSARPPIEKFFFAQVPISSYSKTRFAVVDHPPGNKFEPALKGVKPIFYGNNGNLVLKPGDYVIPVMTYCMNSNGSSPDGHQYALSRLTGPMADVIREINSKALPRFSPHDVQILSWSIQNGLSYDEMTPESHRIIDEIVPEHKEKLKRSFMERFAETWNRTADKSQGLIPSFDNATDEFLKEFGEAGQTIVKIREFRRLIKSVGNDYPRLSELIQRPGRSPDASIPWSKISDSIYARFVTKGHFQSIGQIQIRVLSQNLGRGIDSVTEPGAEIDLSSWVADPMSNSIQPLSFSALYGVTGVLVVPELVTNPVLMGILLGAVLASQPIDWSAFYKMSELAWEAKVPEIDRMIDQGTLALHKAHDELEKPARELGVIDRKTKNISESEKGPSRNYKKPGGEEALKKDFDKFPGDVTSPEPGIDMKILPNGSRIVKRPQSVDNEQPTLEIQPPKTGNKIDDGRRIKVRYSKE
jgi:hypothetical protein